MLAIMMYDKDPHAFSAQNCRKIHLACFAPSVGLRKFLIPQALIAFASKPSSLLQQAFDGRYASKVVLLFSWLVASPACACLLFVLFRPL
jgi:hypothetical protein